MVKVSIITICLNDIDGLKKTCPSVLNQDYENMEYIIIDGGSNDGSITYVESLCEKYSNITFVSEHDDGRSDAFNKGTKKATGELLLFLNSSDFFLHKDVVSEAVREWNEKPVDILGYCVAIDTGSIMYADDDMWKTGFIPHQGMFIQKSAIEKVGLYNKYLINRMDYDLCLKLVKEGCTYRFIDRVIVQYDSSGISSLNHYNARLEGLGLELIYRKSVEKQDLQTLLELYNEKHSNENYSSLDNVKINDEGKFEALQKKYTIFRSLLNKFISGVNIADYFFDRNIRCLSIYGMADIGNVLYKIFTNAGIEVPFCIDRDKSKKVYGVEIKQLEHITDDIQAIVVTNIVGIDEIKETISKYTSCQILTVFDLL